MQRVGVIVGEFYSFFQDETNQKIHWQFKANKCDVYSLIERIGKNEINWNLSTSINFGKRNMKATASNRCLCNVTFYSNKFQNNDFKIKISDKNLCPFHVSSVIHKNYKESSICQKSSIIIKALPFSADSSSKLSFFDFAFSTRFSNSTNYIRFDTFQHLMLLSLEGIHKFSLNDLIAANFTFDISKKYFTKTNITAKFNYKRICMSVLLSYPRKSTHISLLYSTSNKNTFGILIGFEKAQNATEPMGKVAASFDLGEKSTLHAIIGTDKQISVSFAIDYSKFLKMKFVVSQVFANQRLNFNGFGMSMFLDL